MCFAVRFGMLHARVPRITQGIHLYALFLSASSVFRWSRRRLAPRPTCLEKVRQEKKGSGEKQASVDALTREVEVLRSENAALRRQAAEADVLMRTFPASFLHVQH